MSRRRGHRVRARRLLAALVVLAALFAQAWPAAAAPASVLLPVLLDGQELVEVEADFAEDNTLTAIDGTALVGPLRDILVPEALARMQHAFAPNGRLPRAALAQMTIGLEYEAATLELTLSIPPALRRRVDVRLGAGDPFSGRAVPVSRPAALSGYLNIHAAADYLNDSGTGSWREILDLDGAATAFGSTIEGAATYRNDGRPRWSRGDIRVVHDLVDSRIRLSAGDLAYGVDGFQSMQRLAGIAVGRDFALQPYRSSTPAGETTLLVEQRSRVDVLVNGRRVDTLTIAPGRYNVRDFPFAPGANDITLRLTDEVGRVETLNYPFIYDSTVLARGEHDFSYAVGFASAASAGGRAYDTGRPAASFFHAAGLTDQFTLGVNGQVAPGERLAGAEARWAARIGTLRADAALWSADHRAGGYAARLQYRYLDTIGEHSSGRTLEVSAAYRSRAFAGLGALAADNPVAADFGARYGQRLFGPVYAAAGVDWQIGRGATADSYSAELSLSATLAAGFNAYALVSRNRSAGARADNRFFIAISWFPDTSNSVTATEDTRTRASRVQWHRHPSRAVETWETDAIAERSPSARSFRGEVNYTGYRFKAGITHDREYGDSGGRQSTDVNLASALAFADGHFAVSRPIADSFALIAAHPALDGKVVEVNAAAGVPQAKADAFGPAMLPDLTSYYRQPVLLEAPDLPEGIDLGATFYTLQPRYRSGTVIQVGNGATVLLQADLRDYAGTALGLELGSAAVAAQSGQAPLDFFTNSDGRMRIAGAAPGKVIIQLRNYPETPVTIEIPQGASGLFDAGIVTVPIAVAPSILEK